MVENKSMNQENNNRPQWIDSNIINDTKKQLESQYKNLGIDPSYYIKSHIDQILDQFGKIGDQNEAIWNKIITASVSLQKENEGHKKDVINLQNNNKALQEQIVKLKSQLQEVINKPKIDPKVLEDNKKLTEVNKHLLDENSKLKEILQNNKKNYEESMANLKEAVKKNNQKIVESRNSLLTENQDLKIQLAELRGQISVLSNTQSHYEEAINRLGDTNVELKNLKDKFNSNKLVQQNKVLQDEINTLRQENNKLQNDNRNYYMSIATAQMTDRSNKAHYNKINNQVNKMSGNQYLSDRESSSDSNDYGNFYKSIGHNNNLTVADVPRPETNNEDMDNEIDEQIF